MNGSILSFQDQECVKHYQDALTEGFTQKAEAIYEANPDLQVHFRNVAERLRKENEQLAGAK